MTKRKLVRKASWFLAVLFLLLNVVAFFHAWRFTHFSSTNQPATKNAAGLSAGQKIKALFFGIVNPKPVNTERPTVPYQTLRLQSNKEIDCWLLPVDSARGTVILFHGYRGEKSGMLDKAMEFRNLGYQTLLVDFMGSGGSEGYQTTIGFKEAAEVQTCLEYIQRQFPGPVFLFGTSMGAAAVLHAMDQYDLKPAGLILECPFGSMYQTTCTRFRNMGVPCFPMAGLLVFWGGVQNGFWAFGHNPVDYARSVTCPVLLLFGEKDDRVSRAEIDAIYKNLAGPKELKSYPEAGHANYLGQYRQQWVADVSRFLEPYSRTSREFPKNGKS